MIDNSMAGLRNRLWRQGIKFPRTAKRADLEALLDTASQVRDTTADVYRFVRDVAGMRPDGEGTDAEGDDWIMENDDAVETLCSLIYQARDILGEPEDQPERWQS